MDMVIVGMKTTLISLYISDKALGFIAFNLKWEM